MISLKKLVLHLIEVHLRCALTVVTLAGQKVSLVLALDFNPTAVLTA